jgi:hypothetical protein
MKKIASLLILTLVLGGFLFSKTDPNVQKLIVGKWINEKNIETQFTLDKKILLSGVEAGTYRFVEDTPVIICTLENKEKRYELKFVDDDTLITTEIRVGGKKNPEKVLKRIKD